jgi:glycosyltransferase involved in cell wall biosynthesis
MKKIFFVVHRYAPFPGGSENHVRDMAEECVARGHYAAVFTGEHKGDLNGVHVTSDPNVLLDPSWDLIVVHGGDVGVQNFVLTNIDRIPSKVLFVLIRPSDSQIYDEAIRKCYKVGCCTLEDWDFVKQKNILHKSVRINYGVDEKNCVGTSGFREKYNIQTKYMIVSCGGFWPNKAMNELSNIVNEIGRDDMTLVLTGYDNRHNIIPQETKFVKPIMVEDRNDVMSAIKESDLYVMHSFSEGFGLVLLESMLNKTPWVARGIAGAKLMKEFGFTYESDSQLKEYLIDFPTSNNPKLEDAHEYAILNHSIKVTVNDILKCIGE